MRDNARICFPPPHDGKGAGCVGRAEYMGRSGIARCVGLSLYVNRRKGTVELWPVNFRGVDGRCFIEVPCGALPSLVDSFAKLGVLCPAIGREEAGGGGR